MSVSTQRGHLTRLLHHQGSCRSSGFVGPRIASPTSRGESTRFEPASDELATALGLADEFADLLRKRACGTLSDWLVKGEASTCPEIRRFAEGIRRDEAAVLAAVTETVEQWSRSGCIVPKPSKSVPMILKMDLGPSLSRCARSLLSRSSTRALPGQPRSVAMWPPTLRDGRASPQDRPWSGREVPCCGAQPFRAARACDECRRERPR